MSLHGVRTIAVLELRQRLRTSRWPVVIGIWFLIIGAVAGLTWWAVTSQSGDPATTLAGNRGTTLYDVVLFFVLGLGMLVVPSLTATSINGDREHGVLATMQTTLLTPADIVIGKLASAWVISLAFLLAASPFLVWAWIAGGVEVGRMLLAVAVLVFVLAVVCALGLMFSTLTARTISSAVLTYLTVAALTVGTVIAFLLSMPILSTQASVRVKVVPDSFFQSQPTNPDGTSVPGPTPTEPTPADCVYVNREQTILHTERTWWLLALNPFVVVADAAPSRKPLPYLGFEPLQLISDGARTARMGTTPDSLNECWPELAVASLEPQPNAGPGVGVDNGRQEQLRRDRLNKVPAVWPYGFVFLGVLGAVSTWVAVRRLRTPIRKLPRGTRIA